MGRAVLSHDPDREIQASPAEQGDLQELHWINGRFNKLGILPKGKYWNGIWRRVGGADRAEPNASWLKVSLLSHLMFNTLFKVWHIPGKVWEVILYHWPRLPPTQSKCFCFGLCSAFTVRIHRVSSSPFRRCICNSRMFLLHAFALSRYNKLCHLWLLKTVFP